MARYLFPTLGSLGDLRPAIAVAAAIQRAGDQAAIASGPEHRALVERHGLEFVPLGDEAYLRDARMGAAIHHPRHGGRAFIHFSNIRQLDRITDELMAAAEGAAAIVAPPLMVPAPLVAAALDRPLIGYCISVAAYALDRRDRPPDALVLRWRSVIAATRSRLGLPPMDQPERESFDAPSHILGLFPKFVPTAWTGRSIEVVGFPILPAESAELPQGLADWMAQNRFVLFTFGSHVDEGVKRFATMARAACRSLGLACLFQTVRSEAVADLAGADMRIERFVPMPPVLSRAAAVVHHGGLGTSAEVLRAGVPAVIMPFMHDQPFNAIVLFRADFAERLEPAQCSSERLADALRRAIANGERRRRRAASVDIGVGEHIADAVAARLRRIVGAP